jgi:hypothetical protein
LQDIVMGLFGRYTIPADYKLANSVAEFVMSKLPRSAPYGAPFTTDVAHCCGDPETCNDPCEPAIDTAGAKLTNAQIDEIGVKAGLMERVGKKQVALAAELSATEMRAAIRSLLATPARSVADGDKQEAVAQVDEGDDGLFVEILHGPNGSPLKRGDKLYAAPLAQSAEQDRIDAERYRFLRDKMRFSSPPGDIPTMTLNAPLEAPTHDTHKDWISDRFDASVDRTIDAAMERAND